MKALVTSFLVLSSLYSFANSVEKAFLHYCNGDSISAKQTLENTLASDPSNVSAYFFRYTYLPQDSNTHTELYLNKIREGETPSSELENLLYVHALIQDRSNDIARMKALLSFHSDVSQLESWRLAFMGWVSGIAGNNNLQFNYLERALGESKNLEAYLLASFLSLEPTSPQDLERQKEALRKIAFLDFENPYRNYIQLIQSIQNEQVTLREANNILESIFESCPTEMLFRIALAQQVAETGQTERAFRLLREISDHYAYYPVYVDVLLAKYALEEGKTRPAERYFERARKSPMYLSDLDKRELASTEAGIQAAKEAKTTLHGRILLIGGLALVLLILSVFGYLARRRKNG